MSLIQLLDLTDQYIATLQEENQLIRKMMINESKPVMEKKMQISQQYNAMVKTMKEHEFGRMSKEELKLLKSKSQKLKKVLADNTSLITFAIKLSEEMLVSVVEQLGGKGGKNKGYNHMGLKSSHGSPKPITLSETL